jgi:hypothetical protein
VYSADLDIYTDTDTIVQCMIQTTPHGADAWNGAGPWSTGQTGPTNILHLHVAGSGTTQFPSDAKVLCSNYPAGAWVKDAVLVALQVGSLA